MMNVSNNDNKDYSGIILVVFILMLSFVIWILSGCTSNHYFSINAEEMTNPRIEYHDSTQVVSPF